MEGFGGRLREALKGYSQQEFAQLIGYSPSTISNWINNKDFPPSEVLKKICEKLNCSADWLLGLNATSQNEYNGIKWAKTSLTNITPSQTRTIELAYKLCEYMVKEHLSIRECLRKKDLFPDEDRTTLNRAFTIAVRSGALRLIGVNRNKDLEASLKTRFSELKDVIVAAVPQTDTGEYIDSIALRTELVAFLAATEVLAKSSLKGEIVGIDGGYSVLRTAELSIPSVDEFVGTKWISLETVRTSSLEYPMSARFITNVLANKHFGSEAISLPFIAPERREHLQIASSDQTADEREAAQVIAKLQNASAIFMTVAGENLSYSVPFHTFAPKLLQGAYRDLKNRQLLDQFAGSILGWMLNDHGKPIGPNEIEKITFTITLDMLADIAKFKKVWVIAAKEYKGKAVLMALRSGLANSLVIDAEIADFLLSSSS